MKKFRGYDHTSESHQRPQSPGVYSSQSSILDRERAQRESLMLHTQKLYAAELARTNSVLKRMGLCSQQDPLPSPQPRAVPRCKPVSSLRGCTVTPVFIPFDVPAEDGENTQRHRTSPEAHHGKNRGFSQSACASSDDTLSSVDSHTPHELRTISLIRTPVEVSRPHTPFTAFPPSTRSRVSRIPVMIVNRSAADKEVAAGHSLQTAHDKMATIREEQKQRKRNSAAPLPRPVAAPQKNPAVAPFTPAPPPKPAPAKRRTRGMTIHAARTDGNHKLQTGDSQKQEELRPLSHPKESLALCFTLLSSEDWMNKVEGLQCIRALAQHHPDSLMVQLHEVCLAVTEEVKNLRSSVACAAINTIASLYVHLQRDMDGQVERTGRALLLKIAQSSANVFIQQQVNLALEALVQNCSAGRVLPALLNMGMSHLSAAVRASTARQLHLLADRMGAAAVLKGGQKFTQRFLTAASNMSLDAAAEVRPHGYAILRELALHPDFMKLWQRTVAEKDRNSLEKVLKNSVRK